MTEKKQPGTDLDNPLNAAIPARITDPAEAALSIVNRILAAPTLEDVFKLQGTLSADEILDRPFTLHTIEFRKSDYEQASPVYSFMNVMFDDGNGELYPITCGGSNVNAQALRTVQIIGLKDDGRTLKQPVSNLKLVKAHKPTAAGYYPLWLTMADAV